MSKYCCDCDDISDLSDADLLNELRERKSIGAAVLADLDSEYYRLRRAIEDGRKEDALAYLDRVANPRWSEIRDCERAYKAAKMPPPPPPRYGVWYWQ